MVGSFKSTVWDYYLPTDVHEASKLSNEAIESAEAFADIDVGGMWENLFDEMSSRFEEENYIME